MDDELPLLIMLVAKSNYPDLINDLNIIEDFVEYESDSFESEQRLLLNLKVT